MAETIVPESPENSKPPSSLESCCHGDDKTSAVPSGLESCCHSNGSPEEDTPSVFQPCCDSNDTPKVAPTGFDPCCHSSDTPKISIITTQSDSTSSSLPSCRDSSNEVNVTNSTQSNIDINNNLKNVQLKENTCLIDDSVADSSSTDPKVKKKTVNYTKWTNQQRAYCVKQYYYQKCTFKGLGPEFCKFFKAPNAPDRKVIKRWVAKFEAYGTVDDFKKARDDRPTNSGRPKKRTTEVVATIYNSIEMDPDLSLRARAKKLGIPRSTLRRAMREDIKRPTGRRKTKANKDATKKPKEASEGEKSPPKKDSYIETPWGAEGNNFELYTWADFMGGCGPPHTTAPNLPSAPSVPSVILPPPSIIHPQRCLAPPLHSAPPSQGFFHPVQDRVKIEASTKSSEQH